MEFLERGFHVFAARALHEIDHRLCVTKDVGRFGHGDSGEGLTTGATGQSDGEVADVMLAGKTSNAFDLAARRYEASAD